MTRKPGEDQVDEDAFDEFYRGTARRLLGYAYAMCGDLGTAQDLTQEAYVRAWQRWRKVGTYEQPEAWLRLVVSRLATDRWRRLQVRSAALGRAGRPEYAPPPSENGVMLAAALRRIPANQRRAVVMHYLLDMSVADIAVEMGTRVGTVKSWLARGRDALGGALGAVPEMPGRVPDGVPGFTAVPTRKECAGA